MPSPEMLYIAGITPRSGTNYLYKLLANHPSCTAAEGGEDYFLLQSDYLRIFTHKVYTKWDGDWRFKKENMPKDLSSYIGDGLIRFLREHTAKENPKGGSSESTVITKTPHANNISHFWDFFPRSFLVLLIRDGRAVTESSLRTFDLSFDAAAHIWKEGAKTVLSFIDAHGEMSDRHCVVRYEDVFRNPQRSLGTLFEAASLSVSLYPEDALDNIPVVGSSTFGQSEGGVTWEAKKANSTFDPTQRFTSWSDEEHDRFNWIAGDELRALGYGADTKSHFSVSKRTFHRVRDLRDAPRRVKKQMRNYVKSLFVRTLTS